jgi:hypothetical protein
MVRGITDITGTIGMFLPPWALALLGVLLVAAAFPFWLNSMRIKQISGRSRRMVRAEHDERQRLANEILDLAGDNSTRLLAAVEQTTRYGLRALRTECVARLRATGERSKDLAQILAKEAPERKPIGHAIEAIVTIERMLEEGLGPAARTRLDEALTRYPHDPELLQLKERAKDV